MKNIKIEQLLNVVYERRRPENSVLYQIIQNNYLSSKIKIESNGILPFYVKKEFESFMKCGILSEGFLRVHCSKCNSSKLVAFSCKKRGLCPSCGARRMNETADHLVNNVIPAIPMRQWVISFPFKIRYLMAYDHNVLSQILGITTRAIGSYYQEKTKKLKLDKSECGSVSFIQRFGGSLNLNVHFHILFADGVFYEHKKYGTLFKKIKLISNEDIEAINKKIRDRVFRALKKKGLIEEYEEGNYQLNLDALNYNPVLGYANSIENKIGIGKNKGKKNSRVGNVHKPSWMPFTGDGCSYLDGFSLHAGIKVGAFERNKLEKLLRYTARPALAHSRISTDLDGKIIYKLKTRYTDGTTHLSFTPEEFIEKLVGLIPPPRKNLIRFHGVFAPNSKRRSNVTNLIKKRTIFLKEKLEDKAVIGEIEQPPPKYWTPWADLLKKVFRIDALLCHKCGGRMNVAETFTDHQQIKEALQTLNENIVDTGFVEMEPGDYYQIDYY